MNWSITEYFQFLAMIVIFVLCIFGVESVYNQINPTETIDLFQACAITVVTFIFGCMFGLCGEEDHVIAMYAKEQIG